MLKPEVGGDCPRLIPMSTVGEVREERGVSIVEGISIRGDGGFCLADPLDWGDKASTSVYIHCNHIKG